MRRIGLHYARGRGFDLVDLSTGKVLAHNLSVPEAAAMVGQCQVELLRWGRSAIDRVKRMVG